MKYTYDTFRQRYIEELQLPDIYHGSSRPKVKYISKWQGYEPWYANQKLTIDTIDTANPPRIFVWSDLHFGHGRIIEYATRPFPDVHTMASTMIGNYFNTITPNDIVIFGGDIGFMSETKINAIVSSMPGYKIQIIGNHDIHRDGKLYKLAFDERHPCYVIDVKDGEIEYQLVFTHYPLNDVPDGCINVHGHIHQNPAPTPKHFNMCVEHTNFAPCPITKVLELGRATYTRSK